MFAQHQVQAHPSERTRASRKLFRWRGGGILYYMGSRGDSLKLNNDKTIKDTIARLWQRVLWAEWTRLVTVDAQGIRLSGATLM